MIKNKKDIPPYPIVIDLTGPDGNAFVLMGKAKRFAQDLDLNSDSPTMVGTVVNTGLDIDVVGGTSGTQSNIGIDLDVDGAAGDGSGAPGTILDFWYPGVENVVFYRGNLIGSVDSATLANHFSTAEVDA